MRGRNFGTIARALERSLAKSEHTVVFRRPIPHFLQSPIFEFVQCSIFVHHPWALSTWVVKSDAVQVGAMPACRPWLFCVVVGRYPTCEQVTLTKAGPGVTPRCEWTAAARPRPIRGFIAILVVRCRSGFTFLAASCLLSPQRASAVYSPRMQRGCKGCTRCVVVHLPM